MPALPPSAAHLQGITPEKRLQFIHNVSEAVLKPVMHRFDSMEKELEKVSFEVADEKERLVYSQDIIDSIIQTLANPTIGDFDPTQQSTTNYSEYVKTAGDALEKIGRNLKNRFMDQDLDHEDVGALKKEFGSLMNRSLAMEKALDSMDDGMQALSKVSQENTANWNDVHQSCHSLEEELKALGKTSQENTAELKIMGDTLTDLTKNMEPVVEQVSELAKTTDALSSNLQEVESASNDRFEKLEHDIQNLFLLFQAIDNVLRSNHHPKHEENHEHAEKSTEDLDENDDDIIDEYYEDFVPDADHSHTHTESALQRLRRSLKP